MTGFTRHSLPAEIAVFAGCFQSQPLAFAYLQDAAPDLDLDHVEVIRAADPRQRLRAHFGDEVIDTLTAQTDAMDTIILILPAAYGGLNCPLIGSETLTALGAWRGVVTRLVAIPEG